MQREIEQDWNMIAAIIIAVVAAAIVVGYLVVVNWFLRGDDHYHSDAPSQKASLSDTKAAANFGAGIAART